MSRCLPLLRPAHFVGGLLVLLLGLSSTTASGRSFLVGEWNDDEIREHVAELRGFADDAPEGETVLCLNRSIFVQTSRREHKTAENREFYVYDRTAEDLATQHIYVSRRAEMEEFRAWVLRTDGTVDRLDEDDDIVWREGDDETLGELVFHYPNFEEGDVFGFSYRIRQPGPYPGAALFLAIDHPVASGHFYLSTRGDVAYRMTARNVTKDFVSLRNEEAERGDGRLLVADFRSIPALSDEPFRMPPVRSVPYLDLIVQARWTELKGNWGNEGGWFRVNSWNHQAKEARELADSYVGRDRVRDKTEEILSNRDPEQSVEQALFDFVRLEIRDRAPAISGFHQISRSAKEILEQGVASANEKCLMLHAMMNAAQIPTNVAFLRSYHLGPVDMGSPDVTQLTELAVLRTDRLHHWLWPVDFASRPGILPPWLRQSTAFLPGFDMEEKFDRLSDEAALESGHSLRQFLKVYHRMLKGVQWYSFVETQGDAYAVFGSQQEELTLDPQGGQAVLAVGFRGSVLPDDVEIEGDGPTQREFLRDYVAGRWPDEDTDTQDQANHRIASNDSLITLSATLAGWSLPDPGGDVWILPSEKIFGRGRLAAWNGPDRGPMFVDCGEEYAYRARVPIPAGWKGVMLPEGLRVVNPRLTYEASFSADAGFVVVDRSLVFRAGVTPKRHLDEIDADIQKILAFESQPIVLEPARAESR